MPLRDYRCEQGHLREVLVRGQAEPRPCDCGASSVPVPVNRIEPGYRHKWGSEFEWTPDMLDAHEHAKGYKREMVRAREEAIQNGFRL